MERSSILNVFDSEAAAKTVGRRDGLEAVKEGHDAFKPSHRRAENPCPPRPRLHYDSDGRVDARYSTSNCYRPNGEDRSQRCPNEGFGLHFMFSIDWTIILLVHVRFDWLGQPR